MSAIESEPAAATADPAAEEDVGTGIPAQPGALVGVAARQSDRGSGVRLRVGWRPRPLAVVGHGFGRRRERGPSSRAGLKP